MSDERNHNNDPDGKRTPAWGSGIKPAQLKPAQLKSEPAREVAPARIEARKTALTGFGDHRPRSHEITEKRPDSQAVESRKIDLRKEQEKRIEMTPVPITAMQMSDLRARRVASRELGWSVPGAKIRLREDS